MIPPRRRGKGKCAQCGRTVLLTVQGKLFLHTDRGWRSGPKGATEVGDHCPGGMTTDFDPVVGDAVKAAS